MKRYRALLLLLAACVWGCVGTGVAGAATRTASKSKSGHKATATHKRHAASRRHATRRRAVVRRPLVATTPLPSASGDGSALPPRVVAPAKAQPDPLPRRAYAVEGDLFYLGGRKIRIDGLNEQTLGPMGSEPAVARLQQLLDSGDISVEPQGTDDTGTTVARVRVNGVDLAKILNSAGP